MIKLKIIVNNRLADKRFKYGWGFSVFVDGLEEGILFDTGPDGYILLKNLKTAGIYPNDIRHIFISHIHLDHIGGLIPLLDAMNHEPKVYIPRSLSKEFEEKINRHGGQVVRINDVTQIYERVYSTGQLGVLIAEQSMVLDTRKGLTLITGCAHPRLNRILSRVVERFPERKINLVIGGFHLIEKDDNYITSLVKFLNNLGIEYIAPTHCSGPRAEEIAKEIFGEHRFLYAGAGSIIEI